MRWKYGETLVTIHLDVLDFGGSKLKDLKCQVVREIENFDLSPIIYH